MRRTRRKGRNSHHSLLAVLAEAQFVLHGWLRSRNTGPARGVIPFLQEALALLPAGTWLRTVRADRVEPGKSPWKNPAKKS